MYGALEIASYIIWYCRQKGYYVSNLKLQKILYFIQAEFLATRGWPCFDEEIQAWDFGPVVPEVYHQYKYFGSSNIIEDTNENPRILGRDRSLIDEMIEECNQYSASQLVDFTHRQSPWMDAYQRYSNNIISKESIRKYFS